MRNFHPLCATSSATYGLIWSILGWFLTQHISWYFLSSLVGRFWFAALLPPNPPSTADLSGGGRQVTVSDSVIFCGLRWHGLVHVNWVLSPPWMTGIFSEGSMDHEWGTLFSGQPTCEVIQASLLARSGPRGPSPVPASVPIPSDRGLELVLPGTMHWYALVIKYGYIWCWLRCPPHLSTRA